MSKIFYMFSGQGSQKVGMCRDFFDAYEQARTLFSTAEKVMGEGFGRLLFEGPEEELKKTEITQPAVFLASYAMASVFEAEAGGRITAGAVCGHSLGEYTAAAFGGAVDFASGIALIRKRGRFIMEASAARPGGMAAVMGADPQELAKLCGEASDGDDTVEAVNFNSPEQTVISGTASALGRVKEKIKAAFPKAKVIPLKVSGAFHSKLMSQAREAMRKETEGVMFAALRPGLTFYSAMDSQASDGGAGLRDLLVRQIDHPVHWTDLVSSLKSSGFDTAVEFGPGEVLSGLVRKTDPSIRTFSVNSVQKMKDTLEVLLNA